MKLVLFFVALFLALTFGIFSRTFERWYDTHDNAHKYFQKSDFGSAKTEIDNFLNSREAHIMNQVNRGFMNDYLAKLMHQRALSSYLMGDKDAGQAFSQAKEKSNLADTKSSIIYNATEALVYGGDLEGAISGYKETLRLNPNDWLAKNNLELLLKTQEQRKKAVGESSMAKPGDKRWKDMELFLPDVNIESGKKKIEK